MKRSRIGQNEETKLVKYPTASTRVVSRLIPSIVGSAVMLGRCRASSVAAISATNVTKRL